MDRQLASCLVCRSNLPPETRWRWREAGLLHAGAQVLRPKCPRNVSSIYENPSRSAHYVERAGPCIPVFLHVCVYALHWDPPACRPRNRFTVSSCPHAVRQLSALAIVSEVEACLLPLSSPMIYTGTNALVISSMAFARLCLAAPYSSMNSQPVQHLATLPGRVPS